MKLSIALVSFPLVLLGCSSASEPSVPAEVQSQVSSLGCQGSDCPGFHQIMELISTGTCDTRRRRLRSCEIPDGTIFPPAIESAVPMRSVLRPVKLGKCSTSYPLELTVSSPELEGTKKFRYIAGNALVLRAPGGAPLTELSLVDESPWTRMASFWTPCTILARIVINEPDVDSTAQAQAVLDSIQLQLDDAVRQRDAYEQLLVFLSAHNFLLAVVDNLYDELTNDMMQELREQYVESMPAFDALADSSACSSELGDDTFTLLNLAGSLFVLGDASDWQNPDGTTKTLAEMYTQYSGDGVVAQIEALAASADPALEEQYRDSLDAAALAAAELEADLALARTQLAYWLQGSSL